MYMEKSYSISGILLAASATLGMPPASMNASTEYQWGEANIACRLPINGISSTFGEMDNGRLTQDTMRRLEMRRLFSQRLMSKSVMPDAAIRNCFAKMAEVCSRIPYSEVFADYNLSARAIRIDMLTDDGFLLMVRKYVDEEGEEVALSLAKKGEVYLTDIASLSSFGKCIIEYRRVAGI